MKLVVGITGASGLQLADIFLSVLSGCVPDPVDRVYVVMSENARLVARAEGFELDPAGYGPGFTVVDPHDFSAPFASGSFDFAGLVVVPASMSSIGAMAAGYGTNLIHRCADVCMKEGRRLVVVPRETPFSLIHLENMTRLKRAGAHVVPFIPSFYNRPQTVQDMLRFFAVRLLDGFGIRLDDSGRWKGSHASTD